MARAKLPDAGQSSAVRQKFLSLRARSLEVRTEATAGVRALNMAVGELRQAARSVRTIETALSSHLLQAPHLVFRRLLPSASVGGRAENQFCGGAAEMIGQLRHAAVWLDQDAWYRRIHPDDLAAYSAAEARCLVSGQPCTMEYRLLHAVTGTFRWVRETAWAGDGSASVLLSHIVDITEQRRADAALRASERRYRTLVEQHEEAICCFGPDYALSFVNRRFCRRVGRSRPELIGTNVFDVMPEEMAEETRARLASLSAGQPAVTYELATESPEGETRYEEWVDRAIFAASGRPVEYQLVGRDVTERRRAEERILRLAFYDALTGLPNRSLFQDRLRQAMARAVRDQNRVALMMIDLDYFKRINDAFGHQFGDQLLRAASRRLSSAVRESDTVARFGGDEFVVVQTALPDHDAAAVLAEKVRHSLAQGFTIDHRRVHVRASLGIALFPDDADEPDALIGRADAALYRAKQQGRNRYCFCQPAVQLEPSQRLRINHDLRLALARQEFCLAYQPRFELLENRCVGFEALLRWRHPKGGCMPPALIVAAAEKGELIHDLGAWVLHEACGRLAGWRAPGRSHVMAVNLSPKQIDHQGLVDVVARAIAEAGLASCEVELEIAESTIIDLSDRVVRTTLGRLAELGVRLSLDDFGRGYSSLTYLSRLPIHSIKIDRSFVANIGRDRADEEIIKAVISLSHSLGRRVVAEGVETAEQLAFLRAEGCDEAQGFLLGAPA